MRRMRYMNEEQARVFASEWLPAWTGNRPGFLAGFYTEHAFYLDPGVPNGLQGKAVILEYFTKLLSRFPDWVWTQTGVIPMAGGFVNKWHAHIPVGTQLLELDGVCLVQLDDSNKIYRNEVYFDRSELLQALKTVR
jgi:hypothetical protein